MHVTLAHDYLTQIGGAERVALSIADAFPGSPLVTSFYEPAQTFARLSSVDIRTSPYNRVPMFRKDPRRALPLLSRIWDELEAPAADAVVASSSGWAHALRTEAPKIVYCHNPARWLYQPDDYLRGAGAPQAGLLKALRSRLTKWDRAAASTVHTYLANSGAVARRIERAYGVHAPVLHPPVMIDPTAELATVSSAPDHFFVTVARQRGYKNLETLLAAFELLPEVNLVVVGADGSPNWPSNVHPVGRVTDAELRWLYSQATALLAPAFEDFGLTVLEAASFGTPACALRAGGYLETVEEGVSGTFFDSLEPEKVARCVREQLTNPVSRTTTAAHAQNFSEEAFHSRLRSIVREAASSTTKAVVD